MNKIKLVYEILFDSFGPQGWWPVTPVGCKGDAMPIYGVKCLSEKQRFEIIIGAILTQNTSWKNVEKALINLNKEKILSIKEIKKINQEKLALLIKSAGYFNQKSERLKIIADFLSKNLIKKLMQKDTEELRKILLEIKGIGPETADSILLYAFEKPIFVIDSYTQRIFGRIGYKKKGYDEWQELFMSGLDKDVKMFNEYHALIVELAKRHCNNKPICEDCPIGNECRKDLNNTKANK